MAKREHWNVFVRDNDQPWLYHMTFNTQAEAQIEANIGKRYYDTTCVIPSVTRRPASINALLAIAIAIANKDITK